MKITETVREFRKEWSEAHSKGIRVASETDELESYLIVALETLWSEQPEGALNLLNYMQESINSCKDAKKTK